MANKNYGGKFKEPEHAAGMPSVYDSLHGSSHVSHPQMGAKDKPKDIHPEDEQRKGNKLGKVPVPSPGGMV